MCLWKFQMIDYLDIFHIYDISPRHFWEFPCLSWEQNRVFSYVFLSAVAKHWSNTRFEFRRQLPFRKSIWVDMVDMYGFFMSVVFPKIMVPQNGWFILETPIKMDDWGYHYFRKHPYKYSWNLKIRWCLLYTYSICWCVIFFSWDFFLPKAAARSLHHKKPPMFFVETEKKKHVFRSFHRTFWGTSGSKICTRFSSCQPTFQLPARWQKSQL